MVDFTQKDNYNIDDLIEIVRLLRGKGGCPWDMEQTHKSLKSDFIEETCEAIEAIDLEDTELLKEELGDVLLQVVFHTSIESDCGNFQFDQVCDGVCKKLIVRHPHVFGDVIVGNTEDVLRNWDSIKMETKGQETYTDTLNSVAKSLPALMRAQKVGKRTIRAIASGNKQKIEEELGDLLFSCVNTARHLGVDAELALKAATDKFIKRFSKTEELVNLDSLDMKELSIEELDVYWDRSKKFIKNNGGN